MTDTLLQEEIFYFSFFPFFYSVTLANTASPHVMVGGMMNDVQATSNGFILVSVDADNAVSMDCAF